ncbi:MAG: ABC transporter permease [Leptotrichiaceae bacterium]|jgi:ABC-type uncharacterized transport system permease subunit
MTKKLREFLPSIMAVLLAMIIGGVIIMLKGANPFVVYKDMFVAAFYQAGPRSPFMSGLAKTLVAATPLIFAALAVMVSFKAGLFNIGAQGQMIAGGLAAATVGVTFHNYVLGNIFVAMVAAIIAGFLWAGIAGYLKAKFGVHEVISTIMLNYIMIELQNYLLNGPLKDKMSQNIQTAKVFEGTRLPLFFSEITKQKLNLGFILAILAVIGVYFFFKYFKKGFEMKAVGYSDTVAENAGISPKLITILAMGMAGGLAGMGGAERVLGGSAAYVYTDQIMSDIGFTGIAVALLGKNNPIGIFIAAIFYASLDIGGQILQSRHHIDKEIVIIIQALIIIFVAGERMFDFIKKGKVK